MKKLILTCLLLVACSNDVSAIPRAFIIIGQSNACGRGELVNLSAHDYYVPNYIKYIGNRNYYEIGVTNYITKTIGDPLFKYGTEVALKNNIMTIRSPYFIPTNPADHYIYIIKACAIESISAWQQGGIAYSRLMETIVQARLPSDTQFLSMYVIQGEHDRSQESLATTYHTRAAKAFSDIRTALQSPTMPIIVTQIGLDVVPYDYTDQLRASQAMLPSVSPYTYLIDTSYIPKFDGLHYSEPKTLANLLWQKWLSVK